MRTREFYKINDMGYRNKQVSDTEPLKCDIIHFPNIEIK